MANDSGMMLEIPVMMSAELAQQLANRCVSRGIQVDDGIVEAITQWCTDDIEGVDATERDGT